VESPRGAHGGHVPSPNLYPTGSWESSRSVENFFEGEKVVGPNVMLDNYILYCVVSCNLFFFSACSKVNCLIIPDAEQTRGLQFTPFWKKNGFSASLSRSYETCFSCGFNIRLLRLTTPPSLKRSIAMGEAMDGRHPELG